MYKKRIHHSIFRIRNSVSLIVVVFIFITLLTKWVRWGYHVCVKDSKQIHPSLNYAWDSVFIIQMCCFLFMTRLKMVQTLWVSSIIFIRGTEGEFINPNGGCGFFHIDWSLMVLSLIFSFVYNDMGDVGMTFLSEALRVNSTITWLQLTMLLDCDAFSLLVFSCFST